MLEKIRYGGKNAHRTAMKLSEEHQEKIPNAKEHSVSLLNWCLGCWEGAGERVYRGWDTRRNRKNGLELWNIASKSNCRVWFKCDKGHSWETRLNNLVGKNTWCGACAGTGTSYPEQVLYHWMAREFRGVHNRYLIDDMEADIYIEELGLVVEYQGGIWHLKKGRTEKDLVKYQHFTELGLQVLWVTDWEAEAFHVVDTIYHLAKSDRNCCALVEQVSSYLFQHFERKTDCSLTEELLNQSYLDTHCVVYERSLKGRFEGTDKESLLEDWDYAKNSFGPEAVTSGSSQIVWWKCSRCGERDYLSVYKKTARGNFCKECRKELKKIQHSEKINRNRACN